MQQDPNHIIITTTITTSIIYIIFILHYYILFIYFSKLLEIAGSCLANLYFVTHIMYWSNVFHYHDMICLSYGAGHRMQNSHTLKIHQKSSHYLLHFHLVAMFQTVACGYDIQSYSNNMFIRYDVSAFNACGRAVASSAQKQTKCSRFWILKQTNSYI